MGLRGPAPDPTIVKLAKGERRPSHVNYHEPALEPFMSTDPPVGLDGAGLHEWQRLVEMLTRSGLLTEGDRTAFEDYCRALTDLRKYEEMAKLEGPVSAAMTGCLRDIIKLRHQVMQLRAKCGLDPSSRTGVRAAPVTAKEHATSERYLSAIPGGKR